MSTVESLKREAPDALMLTGFWYRALSSKQLERGQLRKAMLLENPLVLGRDRAGRPFALRDACPHRGMPLSCGRFDGKEVDRIYAGNYACEERDSFVWVFIPDPGPAGAGFTRREEPGIVAPQVATFGGEYKTAYLSANLPCNVDHGIIGLMDPAHGPFVHQAWWWRSRHSIHEKQKQFEPIPNGFRMSAHTPSSNSAPYKLLRLYADADSITTTIDFVLPNLRYETIRAGTYWFSSLTTVTPITRDRCRIDVVACWNIFRWMPFGPSLLKFVFAKFVEQDRRTMELQSEGLKHNPHLMLIDDADRPAKWYFGLKAAHLEAKGTGAAMKHPMAAPVTLQWRS